MNLISIYKNISQIKGGKEVPFDLFLNDIQSGKWQDLVLPIRAMKDEKARAESKKKVPYVTVSGLFASREDAQLQSHSGFIGIDIDDVDPEETKSIICADKHVYAAFTSISGRGLCVIIPINGEKHRESFSAIQEYFYDKYQVVIDPTSVNPSRARFVSFDPDLFHNEHAEKFTAIPKKKAEKKVPEIIFVQSDFDLIVQEIQSRRVSICNSYQEWLKVGFALVDKFGEQGRKYFEIISEVSGDYSPQSQRANARLIDKQYTNCMKGRKAGVTISSFYYLARMAGISTMSSRTKLIAQAAEFAKKGRRDQASVIKYLKDAEGISSEDSADIVAQVFDNNIAVPSEDSLIEQIREWIKIEYDVKRNEITRKIEVNEKEMDDIIFNDIFCACKIVFDKLTAELLQRVIYSSATRSYNPFINFFERHMHMKPKGVIREFFDCIESDTGSRDGEFYPDYVYEFGMRWLVGIVAAMHGKHSPLMLVFSGEQGNGKTVFFRELLPLELRSYFAESKMDNGKDDDILMCKKILIFDDEMSGKSKKEEKRMKELLSKAVITVREPYGRFSIDMKRIAVFCGTTNEQDILNDPTGNRRIIPVHVKSIDFEKINKIDRVALMMEAYWLYRENYNWELTAHMVKMLNDSTGYFEQPSAEHDLLLRHFDTDGPDLIFFTNTEIKAILEMKSMQKLNPTRIGIELKKIGCDRISRKISGKSVKGYYLNERRGQVDGEATPPKINPVYS